MALREAKCCSSNWFSDLQISEENCLPFQNGGIPVGPFDTPGKNVNVKENVTRQHLSNASANPTHVPFAKKRPPSQRPNTPCARGPPSPNHTFTSVFRLCNILLYVAQVTWEHGEVNALPGLSCRELEPPSSPSPCQCRWSMALAARHCARP